jgi:hypothetical protein
MVHFGIKQLFFSPFCCHHFMHSPKYESMTISNYILRTFVISSRVLGFETKITRGIIPITDVSYSLCSKDVLTFLDV